MTNPLYPFCVQVPEQQQDQCVGARGIRPFGLHSASLETESKPHQPDPRESLPAPMAHPAVSITGCPYFNNKLPINICFNSPENVDQNHKCYIKLFLDSGVYGLCWLRSVLLAIGTLLVWATPSGVDKVWQGKHWSRIIGDLLPSSVSPKWLFHSLHHHPLSLSNLLPM